MKYLFLVLIIATLASSFSNKSRSGKVLLIRYETNTHIKVVKDFQRRRKPEKFLGVQVKSIGYNIYKKELDIEGSFKVADSSKILFLDDSSVKDICLPYIQEEITIASLINDSVIQFNLNHKSYILKPGEIIRDSIISIEKQHKKLIQYTKIYSVQNHGLLLKKNVIDDNEFHRRTIEESKIRDSIDIYDLNKLENNK